MAFLRSVTIIGLLTLLSRVFGFVRDLLIASFLGAGPVADAFVVAQRLPNSFRSIFAEGAMDTAFVPIYSRKRRKESPKNVQDFINHIFTILVIVLLPLTGIILFFMPHVVALIAPGFVDDVARMPLAISYSTITFGYLFLISLTSLQGGLLNANGKFGPYASAPVMLNIVMILGFVLAAIFKLDVALVGCWALIIGGVIQMLLVYISCRYYGLSLRFARPRWTVDVKQFFKLVGPGVIGTGADQLNLLITTIMASTLPSGAVAALYYAERLTQLPLGVIGGAVATALLPALTHHIAAKETSQTVHYFSRAVEISIMLCLPAALVLLFMPLPIVQLLFQHGVFDEASTRTTVETICGYAMTIPGYVLVRIFTVRFFAHENTKTPVIVSLVSILINTALAFYLKSMWQHFGIALAYTITMWINAGLLWVMLNVYGYAKLQKATWKKLPRIIFCAAVMSAVVIFSATPAEMAASIFSNGIIHKMIIVVIRFGLSGGTYLAALSLTGTIKMKELRSAFKSA